jgi:N-ethylmaleimide reductase
MKPDLFTPLALGELQIPNRIVMAPLTRSRAGEGNVPTAMNVDYYRQRATAGLIITEATQISQQGQGYAWTPGIHTPAQIAGWSKVAQAVHGAGGRIFMQLWHVGRVSHPSFQPGGALPVAPTAMAVPGKTFIIAGDGSGTWADVPVPGNSMSRVSRRLLPTMRRPRVTRSLPEWMVSRSMPRTVI